MAKQPQPGSTRYLVYKRDGNRCLNCGATEDLTLDHILPQCRGGSNRIDNLQTLCAPCNVFKGNRYPFPVPFPACGQIETPELVDMNKQLRPVSEYHKVDWQPRRRKRALMRSR